MTPSEFYAYCRQRLDDQEEPFLWSSDELWTYIDDAQVMFTRLTGGLRDASSPEATEAAVTANDPWVYLHSSVLFVRGATLASTGRNLNVYNYEDLLYREGDSDYGQKSLLLTDLTKTGSVHSLVLGMEEGRARLVRIPTADDTINLVVDRTPLKPLTEDSPKFEVDSKHHIHLFDWVKALAHRKQDAEAFDEMKADKAEATFRAYCESVRRENERKRHKPRLIRYGGI